MIKLKLLQVYNSKPDVGKAREKVSIESLDSLIEEHSKLIKTKK